MKFVMTAQCQPKNSDTWSPEFREGWEFDASSIDEAQALLDAWCVEAGTSDDPHWAGMGPIATELDGE